MSSHADLAARRTRVAASWLVALVATVVAANAHVLAGGATPHGIALLVSVTLSGFLGMAVVAGRRSGRLSRLGVAAAVVLDQALFHLAFSVLGPAGAITPAGAPADPHTLHLGFDAAALAPLALAPAAAAPDLSMGAHHLVVAVITYGMLLRGTAAVTAALTALGVLLARLLAPVTVAVLPPTSRAATLIANASPSPAAVVLGGIGRRGPPVVALAR